VYSKDKAMEDASFVEGIKGQMERWTELCDSQTTEEWNLKKAHIKQQEEVLTKLFEAAQAAQIKQMEAKHDK
jgi:hypothetical protein